MEERPAVTLRDVRHRVRGTIYGRVSPASWIHSFVHGVYTLSVTVTRKCQVLNYDGILLNAFCVKHRWYNVTIMKIYCLESWSTNLGVCLRAYAFIPSLSLVYARNPVRVSNRVCSKSLAYETETIVLNARLPLNVVEKMMNILAQNENLRKIVNRNVCTEIWTDRCTKNRFSTLLREYVNYFEKNDDSPRVRGEYFASSFGM